MKNKQFVLLLSSIFVLAGCGNKANDSSSNEKDENQTAYKMIFKAYNFLENYSGDFCRTNSFEMTELGQELDKYEEKVIYKDDSNECLYQMNKNGNALYQYFNKKSADDNSYRMYVNTSIDNQKFEYKSNEDCINHFMNIYDDPKTYTDYGDVLVYLEDFVALKQIECVVNVSNSEKHGFLKQATYQDSLEYFKEYFTLLFSQLVESPSKINDLSSNFSYDKVDDLTTIKFSGESSTTFEVTEDNEESLSEFGIEYIFTLDSDSQFTNIERNISYNYRDFIDGQEIKEHAFYFNLSNVETFDYDIGEWTLSENTDGYTIINEYPLNSLEVEVFQTCDGLPFSSSGSLTNFKGEGIIDFEYLDKVVDIIPNQYEIEYRKEGTEIEKVYLDPECTKEFTGSDMKMGKLELYCTYDYLDNVCIYTERFIVDISAYNYIFGNEILFDERIDYSYEGNSIDFGGEHRMCFEESMFNTIYEPIGSFALKNVTINNTTYDKEALLEGFTYNLSNRTIITSNYSLID